MLFKLSNLNSKLALTLGYLNPALNNWALDEERQSGAKFLVQLVNCSVTAPMKIY